MRGDRPSDSPVPSRAFMFTPHARGSTPKILCLFVTQLVYPACAGIDPSNHFIFLPPFGLPRMRGDRPGIYSVSLDGEPFTPHARGSTERTVAVERDIKVYPACAGIDPAASTASQASSRLPRMRGDRPPQVSVSCERYPFTPHARGSTDRGD